MKNQTITLTKENAISIINWIDQNLSENWGSWGNYPTLPVGATYLQYDINPCQINFDKPVIVNGELVNCISANRPVGKKWDKFISIGSLKEWAIEGYAAQRKAAYDSEKIEDAKKFDELPQELKDLWKSCVGLSNNQRKLKLNIKLREYGLNMSRVDSALIAVGRRSESGYPL